MTSLLKRYQSLTAELGTAALVAVSKAARLEQIAELAQAGHRDFGENRVDQLLERAQALKDRSLRWHFIGHLQRNKIKQLLQVPGLAYIHSVDRLELLEALLQRSDQLNAPVGLFLQVLTSGEEQKSGFETQEELTQARELIQNHPGPFFLEGLMTMATYRTDDKEQAAHQCFAKLASMAREGESLSMGMSGDYKIALEHGTNWVRIGTQLFQD